VAKVKSKVKIKLLVCDVDGTLTDGKVHYHDNGTISRGYSTCDGYGIMKLKAAGVEVVFLTGSSWDDCEVRATALGVPLFDGHFDKAPTLKKIIKERKLKKAEVAYIGDDENDWVCRGQVGVFFTPSGSWLSDSIASFVYHYGEKKQVGGNYIVARRGGNGAVREVAEIILKGMV